MAQQKISGVGVRYAIVGALGSDGLPAVGTPSAVPTVGTVIERIKAFSPTSSDAQKITHYGDDLAYAQDRLPPTEVGSFTVNVSQSNLTLEALIQGQKVVNYGAGQNIIPFIGGSTDKRGSEPRVFFATYRQALDTGKTSSTAGSLRQWQLVIYSAVQLGPSAQGFEQGATDKSYSATPTPTGQTIWGETYSEATWGFTQGEFITGILDGQPRFNWWKGNGALTSFQLSHAPITSAHLKVWVNGTLTTPATVNTTNPAFTLSSPPTSTGIVFAIIETNSPGNS